MTWPFLMVSTSKSTDRPGKVAKVARAALAEPIDIYDMSSKASGSPHLWPLQLSNVEKKHTPTMAAIPGAKPEVLMQVDDCNHTTIIHH